ncbi:5-formyltetrahydrofolate cyclo-ligase [candidate division CPR3 bacterium GWF2_35_18]|uniref:5-formyltetrahydrofolate cyclo-ligase n=1 Tax=candidate division CPR3 bacterium GW2011_GWF2_35_18 TaxID=1618350 RepID=A0A0G0BL23_UNCC3|nr:MAG: 5-formyltetrahydrofolate cyclo-ligase family protein [candidate division CPR3 bacterium GW2011_GWF2_35_18]OGB63404.1 MAG: 5-formyltetrahydrofolate cyclo-ligase [candidate division CPR3 bacterium GWF2_35_18]OGB64851.1 MAG: 5-formyltetrahydrofolate cyclo-ligase [candidate division CPR3 bacterium RIFOXYA2_FULL_35_13]OGB76120.1 MAG: 5-formyltetrahydrofolate cyclo-ligase [candidate division CPR3 bacterium RIFOXYC2_FULL_35_7]OGB78971.1 MAG: 5-formyltetrahydrofolate cyclo-ligase [candidate div
MINKIQQEKENLRKDIQMKRVRFNSFKKQRAHERIQKHLYSLDLFQKSKMICFYISTKEEVDTKEIIIKELFLNEREIVVPKIHKGSLKLYKINKWIDLEIGKYGIEEPKKGMLEVDIEKIDLFIVPGVAFDKNCVRLGHGGGYYDKLLQKTRAMKIGLGYYFQILPKIPYEEHDERLDYIISERGIIKMV